MLTPRQVCLSISLLLPSRSNPCHSAEKNEFRDHSSAAPRTDATVHRSPTLDDDDELLIERVEAIR